MPRYVLHDGELVSVQWKTACVELGLSHVNEGKRTLRRQTFFWNCGPSRCCCCNNCNLAAFPSPFAPHIRVGRIDHALDTADGAGDERKLNAAGISASRPAGAGTDRWEPWHVEASASDLRRFHRKHDKKQWETLPRHIVGAVKRFLAARRTVRELVEWRDKIDSKGTVAERAEWQRRDEKVRRWKKIRRRRRRRLEKMLKRARRKRTRRILRQVLDND